jgi:hypothetical protein
MEIRLLEAALMRADGRTNMTTVIGVFGDYAKARKNISVHPKSHVATEKVNRTSISLILKQ